MRATNYSSLRTNLKSFLDSVAEDSVPLVVSRPGAKSVVIMSLDDYNAISETEYILQDKKLLDDIRNSEIEIEKGDVTIQRDDETVEQLLDRLSHV